MSTEINAPVQKAATALGTSAGASVTSGLMHSAHSFLPTDLSGWMAVLASTVACAYTLTLWCEWWWKKFWKPLLKAHGWLK